MGYLVQMVPPLSMLVEDYGLEQIRSHDCVDCFADKLLTYLRSAMTVPKPWTAI